MNHSHRTFLPLALLIGAVLGAAACSSSSKDATIDEETPTATGGTTDTGGAAVGGAGSNGGGVAGVGATVNSGGTDSGGSTGVGGGAVGPSGMPAPATNAPQPTGAPGTLEVLNWAGFKAAASYSFDDTQPSQVDALPALNATGVRMTFYANPPQNWYAGYNAAWKGAVAAGHELGNHTMNHCRADLTGCPDKGAAPTTADAEVDKTNEYIVTNFGQSAVWTMAYPFGDMGWAPLAKTRFILARGVSGGMIGAADATDPYNLPTVSAVGGEDAAAFTANVDAARTDAKWVIFLFHSLLPTTNNWFAGVELTSVTGSIEAAKAKGDVWLDSVVNVGTYWLGQKLVTAATAAAPLDGSPKTWTWTLPTNFPKGRYVRVKVGGGTLSQGGAPLSWDPHGYYEVALDPQTLSWNP